MVQQYWVIRVKSIVAEKVADMHNFVNEKIDSPPISYHSVCSCWIMGRGKI